ncbi:hypothetical protein [Streptomyces apocyni]|uniref:hypothetical protein n=1 Tax=Streptomyces apocyni TaxID=2654677 RepID=UPI0012EAD887|nr:hypothetical protein [Streptomyces apocyni]
MTASVIVTRTVTARAAVPTDGDCGCYKSGWIRRKTSDTPNTWSVANCPVHNPEAVGSPVSRDLSFVWADVDTGRVPCPGCASDRFPSWTFVQADGLRVLTHDGNTICPGDPTFGALTGPEPLPSTESVGVAA